MVRDHLILNSYKKVNPRKKGDAVASITLIRVATMVSIAKLGLRWEFDQPLIA